MKKVKVCRVIFYLAGLLILAFGIILNTKTGLGVSPIISVAFGVSTILNANFGNMTFLWYVAFVVVEIFLHIAMTKRSEESGKSRVKDLKKAVAADVLQIPLSILITRCICLTIALSFVCAGRVIGIGIGTVLAVIGVGRVIALFNYLFLNKIRIELKEGSS